MANPASHFNLYDPSMDEGMATPAERVPDNGGLANLPSMPPQLGALQALAIKSIMEGFAAQPQKGAGNFWDFLKGSPKAAEYQREKGKTQEGISTLNSITGQQNSMLSPYFKADASARGWANLNAREAEGARSDERVQIARDRETRMGYGPAIKVDTTDDQGQPMTMLGNQLPGGKGIMLTDGQVIQPSGFPKPIRITPLMGQNEYGAYNPYTGQIGGNIQGANGGDFRPPLPAGVAENTINTAAAKGSFESLTESFNRYKGSPYPATVQRGIQIGSEKFPGITRDLTSLTGMGDEYDRQVSFMADFNRSLTDYVNAKSGKQYSYMEFLRFANLFPNIANDNDTTFKSKMQNLMSAIERQYGLTTKLYPGAEALMTPGRAGQLGHEADGNTPEKQYGHETTNVGTGSSLDDEFDAWSQSHAPKP